MSSETAQRIGWVAATISAALLVIGIWSDPITPHFTMFGHLGATAGVFALVALLAFLAAI